MTKKQIVSKDNDLIGATYSLGVAEQRLIFLAIIEAREQKKLIDVGKSLRIYAKSYRNLFNVEKNTAYEAMKRAVEGLYEASFSYDKIDKASGKNIHYKSRWVEKIAYADELGCVELTFASDIIPLITRLETQYTEYELKQVSSLQSAYAIRLYEQLIRWRKVGEVPQMGLKELRNKLGVEVGKYKQMNNFKAKVLDRAITQINEHTDIKAEYKQHKDGKVIMGFSFTFKQKRPSKTIILLSSDDSTFIKMTAGQIKSFSVKLANLPALGGNAPIGASITDYAAIIAEHLSDKSKQAAYLPHLKKLGFNPAKPETKVS